MFLVADASGNSVKLHANNSETAYPEVSFFLSVAFPALQSIYSYITNKKGRRL